MPGKVKGPRNPSRGLSCSVRFESQDSDSGGGQAGSRSSVQAVLCEGLSRARPEADRPLAPASCLLEK